VEDDFEDGVYVLSADDYNTMGAPGKYDNFDSGDSPDMYLPVFLSENKPFAQSEEKVVVVYMYYSGSTEVRASEYVFNGTEWQNSARIVERSEQFVHNGTKWVFDPTVVFVMSTSDYQLVVDYVKTEIDGGSDYLNSYKTGEYYFGADAYYENFDLRLSNRTEKKVPGFAGLSTEEAVALTYERLTEAVEVMLMEKYPDATAQVNGVDVHYIVSVDTYENDLSRGLYTFNFKCVKSGPNPEFELVEAPEF
jgi:YHS domain-containing protein